MKKLFSIIALCLVGTATNAQAPYAQFQGGMIGCIEPQGWIEEFLHRQQTGLTGHPEAMSYPYDSCLWAGEIGRNTETYGSDWWRYEQTAYYTDGLLRLGYLLGDREMIAKAEEGIRYTLANASSTGVLGNKAIESMWPMCVYFRVLQAYYERTGDPAIPAALERHYMNFTQEQVEKWRNIVSIEGMLWTYGKTGNAKLLDICERAYNGGKFGDLTPAVAAGDERFVMHGVTCMEELKLPMLLYAYTGKRYYLDLALNAERKPKDACTIARVEGIVRLSSKNTSRGKKVITIETPTGELVDHLVPMNKHVIVHEDDHVHLGDQLTEGPVSPEEILDVCGKERLQEHLVNEVQEVYRLQGVEINDKHVEIIVRQMLRKVVITEPGNTEFLWGDQVDKTTFDRINEQTVAQGGQPAAAKPVLLGITKASLETESFISAASFQDTTRVLTEASTLGKTDTLEGFKENVIMGHLIPAGTGFSRYSKIEVEPAEGAEEIASASEEEEAAELAEDMLNDTINFDNER